eukprot:CAMPEP_0117763574 /NCGR_PEP_ID=MMETSP0947-20121206/18753_1 /TAXON_ID=44440 /ORGANISM="Chattonella subsalsa, Strain CCMP2191" /LENGTH=670 /DNA_ID=CAMNT_0005585375 /DNA_START=307 /DNA_END=2319 /DNA_ORIENTATION=+
MAIVDEYVAVLKRALFQPHLPLGVHVEAEARRTAELQRPPPQEMRPPMRFDGRGGMEGGPFDRREHGRHPQGFDGRPDDVPGERPRPAGVPQRMRFDPERGLVPVEPEQRPPEPAGVSKRIRIDPERGVVPIEDPPAGRGSQGGRGTQGQGNSMKEMARQALADLKNKNQSDSSSAHRSSERRSSERRPSRFSDASRPSERGRNDDRPRRESRFSDAPPREEQKAPVKRIRIDPFAGAVEIGGSSDKHQDSSTGYNQQAESYRGQQGSQNLDRNQGAHSQHQGYQATPSQFPTQKATGYQQRTSNDQDQKQGPLERVHTGENYSYPQFGNQQQSSQQQAYLEASKGYDQGVQTRTQQQSGGSGGITRDSIYGMGQQQQNAGQSQGATGSMIGGMGVYRGLNQQQQKTDTSTISAQDLQTKLALMNQQQNSQQISSAGKQMQQMLGLQAGNSSNNLYSGANAANKNMMGQQGITGAGMQGGSTGNNVSADLQKQMALNLMFLAHQQAAGNNSQAQNLQQQQQRMFQGPQQSQQQQQQQMGMGAGAGGAGGGMGMAMNTPQMYQQALKMVQTQQALKMAQDQQALKLVQNQQAQAQAAAAPQANKLEMQYQQFKQALGGSQPQSLVGTGASSQQGIQYSQSQQAGNNVMSSYMQQQGNSRQQPSQYPQQNRY